MARPLILTSCDDAALIALYSCSMQPSVMTDGNAGVVELSSVRIGSKLGGNTTRTGNDCPTPDFSDGLIASLA